MSSPSTAPIAFIGLGAMGYGMATHLAHTHHVTAYDLSTTALSRFSSSPNASASASPADCITKACSTGSSAITILMVATAQQADAVLFDPAGAFSVLPRSALVLLASTVPASYAHALQQRFASAGRPDVQLIDCPVSGGAARAAAGTLSIMAAGADEALTAATPVLAELAAEGKLYLVPGGMGQGSNMKMCHQVLAAVNILAAAEAMAYAARLGLDLQWVRARLTEASEHDDAPPPGWSWMYENRSARMLDPEFGPLASAVTIIAKDAGIVTTEARRAGFEARMVGASEQVYLGAVARGWGGEDDSGVVRMYMGEAAWREAMGRPGEKDEAQFQRVQGLHRALHLVGTGEALGFARRVGLDLGQLFALCDAAAGGSTTWRTVAPDIITVIDGERQGDASKMREGLFPASTGSARSLEDTHRELAAAVEEMQSLKMPAWLAQEAYGIVRAVQRTGSAGDARDIAVAAYWLS